MPETVTEWRICGTSEQRGAWIGSWLPVDPQATPNGSYELRQYVERNDEVWIEKRTVTYSDIERIDVPTASTRKDER